jgi:hypothetical protein
MWTKWAGAIWPLAVMVCLPAAGAESTANRPTSWTASWTAEPSADAPGRPAAIPAKILRYAERLVRKYDSDGDGRLQRSEWSRMRGNPDLADTDADGLITREEMARHVTDYGRRRKIRLISPTLGEAPALPPLLHPSTASESREDGSGPPPRADGGPTAAEGASSTAAPGTRNVPRDRRFFIPPAHRPQGLPTWFFDRDANGDGQLTLAEYAPKASKAELDEFSRYDANGDGLVTPKECLRGAKPTPQPVTPEQPAP